VSELREKVIDEFVRGAIRRLERELRVSVETEMRLCEDAVIEEVCTLRIAVPAIYVTVRRPVRCFADGLKGERK
jgi:hypothetical protein